MPTDNPGKHRWLVPVVYLSNNLLSLIGVVIVTGATIFWLFLLPTILAGEASQPYMGILTFLALPALFLLGLALIPLGIWLRRKRKTRTGTLPSEFPALTWQNPELRRLVVFIGAATFVNIVIASQLTYSAVTYMESVSFCGQACHVMQPEFTAFQASAHSNVECVKCHIGPGASGFVQAKVSGIRQVVSLALNKYQRPIPTPIHNLRRPDETCQHCHSPARATPDRMRVIAKYSDDEANTLTHTVLLMKVGGGGNSGIHGAHLGPGVSIRYGHSDEARQTIPWVEYSGPDRKTVYAAADAKPDGAGLQFRSMDCLDCHNRPAHTFEAPDRAVDQAMRSGAIPSNLPFAKQKSLEILKADYASRSDAASAIPLAFEVFYRDRRADIYATRSTDVKAAAQRVLEIYNRNVFPDMKVKWGTYPNNLGHTDFPGCYRCHDGAHSEPGGRSISQDCNSCHNLLAMDEANPKVLEQIGLVESKEPEKK
jgi:hypothetical protein